MAMTEQINDADTQALINIVLDYTRGHSIDEITHRLKDQCTKFDIACKARYQAIGHNDSHKFNDGVDAILDALSVGGCQLHLMELELAKQEGKINCYVWDGSTLAYLQSGKDPHVITLKDSALFINEIQSLTQKNNLKTIHLYARQIDTLVTLNSEPAHIPHITNQNLIHQCKSSTSLYALLKKLEPHHPRLSILIEKIDQTKPARHWWTFFMVAAGLTATAGVAFLLEENFTIVKAWYERTRPIVARWLHNTVFLLSKTPLLGILFLLVPLIQSWHQTIVDGSITTLNKLIRLLFKTVVNTLPIIGYVLCYLAAGAMTVPAVALFITSAVLDVIETLYTLIYHEVERQVNPLAPATEYYSASAKACADNTHQRNLSIFVVKFTANILATASVVVWCVFPPNLVIALACLAFSTLISLSKGFLVSTIKDSYAKTLQSHINDICEQHNPPASVIASPDTTEPPPLGREVSQQKDQLLAQLKIFNTIREADTSGSRSLRFFLSNPLIQPEPRQSEIDASNNDPTTQLQI